MTEIPYARFPDGYRVNLLHEVCVPNGVQTGPFGSQLHQRDYVEQGIPILTVEHLGDNRIIHRDLPFVSQDDAARLRRYLLEAGDIVFSRVGSVDRRALVREEERGWLFSGRCLRVRADSTRIDPAYLSWYFGLESFRGYVRNIAVGATMPSLNTTILSRIPICYPEIAEQRAIAGVLGALDDKIELNRSMNETLDRLIELQFAKLNAEASTTWTDASIADLADFVNGRNFTKDASGTGRMVIRIAELNSGPGASTVYADTAAPDQHIARADDILFAWSGSLGVYRWRGADALVNQHIFKVIPKVPAWFVYRHLRRAMPLFREIAADKATTMGHIKRGHLSDVTLKVPPPDVLNDLSALIEPLEQKVAANDAESRTLAALRDALLPKLISGELRLRQAEAVGKGT